VRRPRDLKPGNIMLTSAELNCSTSAPKPAVALARRHDGRASGSGN
jgi:hypothetical protein